MVVYLNHLEIASDDLTCSSDQLVAGTSASRSDKLAPGRKLNNIFVPLFMPYKKRLIQFDVLR
jgi:hypothetical protein